jgi:hypothetical protein
MPIWILIAIALVLFPLGVKAVLRLGFRRFIIRMHAGFLSYMRARSPHLALIDRSDRIEIRVRDVKVASVAWRVLHKRLSELPKEIPDRRMIAFEKFAAVIEELAAVFPDKGTLILTAIDSRDDFRQGIPKLAGTPASDPLVPARLRITGDGITVMKV